jgi:hypothetical protein
MKRHWGPRVLKFLLFFIVAILLGGAVVMWLWNMLVPPIFGWHAITFAQAIGLLVLSKILFGRGRFGGPWRGTRWRRRMWERWDQMTPEEREHFRAGMHGRCGAAEPKPTQPVSSMTFDTPTM